MADDGYVLLPDLLTVAEAGVLIAFVTGRLREKEDEGWHKERGTLHLDGLERAHPLIDRLVAQPAMTASAEAAVGPSVRVARVHYRAPQAGEGAQALHRDWSRWMPPDQTPVATAIVALTDFTADNGSTRVVPGSHLVPQVRVATEPDKPHPGQVVLTPKAGSGFLFSGILLHSGTRRAPAAAPRHSLLVSFSRG